MKFKSRLKVLLCLLVTSVACFLPAQAQQPVSINGFGSVRLGKLLPSKDNPQLVEFYNDDGLSFADDTLFGLQLQTESSADLSYTLQLLGKALEDYDPDVSLAFVRYQLAPDHQLKFGRLAVPLFAQSDIQYVGYSHDYSRLPKALYYRFDFEVADGVAFEGQQIFQDFSLKYVLQLTEFSGNVFKRQGSGGIPIKLHQMNNLRLELAYQQLQLFAGGVRADTDADQLNAQLLAPLLPQLQASTASLAAQQQFMAALNFNKDAAYTFWGLRWQYQAWRLEAERSRYGISDSADVINTAEYLALSYRFDRVIVTLHQEKQTENPENVQWLTQVTAPELRQIGINLSRSLNNTSYRMQVLSLRYDLQPGIALKADIFNGKHQLANVGRFKGFSLGVDFVF
ncbi:hypothetical protein EOE67_08535 [Rheinheimera riviphila]|uniref:Porin n=1 Tax=Rheinheimera riviphila TaxID=1834037 RepID=A0A437QZI5_9GAMM|nr:hypothetical protein [Rheinheimera riviphila]RVU39946.1 hypothetical protein EOE67_08535 [Rheinheimera riviphila]